MNIFFNGRPRDVPDNATVSDLLVQAELDPRRLAVEVNLELVPRQRHAEHVLQEGDRLEVVTLVGGG